MLSQPDSIFSVKIELYSEMEMNISSEIDWMDDETRVRAKEKLRTMKEYIG